MGSPRLRARSGESLRLSPSMAERQTSMHMCDREMGHFIVFIRDSLSALTQDEGIGPFVRIRPIGA